MQDTAPAAILAIILIIFAIIIALYLAYVIPLTITTWRLYGKAGKPGWASLVPVYSTVVMAQIAKKPDWIGWTAGIASIAPSIFSGIGRAFSDPTSESGISNVANRASYGTVTELSFAGISIVASLAALVLSIIILIGFIQQYRHAHGESTVGFWVCYFILPIAAVFMVNNIIHSNDAPVGRQAAAETGQQPIPPYVPPVA